MQGTVGSPPPPFSPAVHNFVAEVSATVVEEMNSLEDLYLEEVVEEEEVEEGARDEHFLVALRLSPEPVHLVKGYEFKMLNKYTLTHSPFLPFPLSSTTVTAHFHN